MRSLLAADDDDPLEALRAVSELSRETARHEATLVRRARILGYGWQMVATALGIPRRTVLRRYGRR